MGKKYDQNYAAKGAADPAAHIENPGVMPHIGRVIKFERTPMEAWREYQDEVNQAINERHAIRIQARARGMLGRTNTLRVRQQHEMAMYIQKHWRAKIARKRLRETKRRYELIAMLFAKGERKAVMKLELAYLRRRERQHGVAAHIVQAHWQRRKQRMEAKEQLAMLATVQKMVPSNAPLETNAAMKIQYWWWQTRARNNEKRDAEQQQLVHAQVAQEEAARQAERERERRDMDRPVEKQSRRVPWEKFQPRKMRLATHEGKLYYHKPDAEHKPKEIELRHVIKLQAEEDKKSGEPRIIVLGLKKGEKNTRGGKLMLRFESERVRDTWLRKLQGVCHNVDNAATGGAGGSVGGTQRAARQQR